VPSNPLQTELANLFEQRKYQGVLDRTKADEITPASDPQAANIVAASLFQLGRFPECLLWCEGLQPALEGDPSFSSMYGAVLRRIGRLDEAETVFRQSLKQHADNIFLQNNFANLLIDKQNFEEAEKILKNILTLNPSYEDARVNLNRLEFQKNLANSSPKTSQDISNSNQIIGISEEVNNAFIDPLEAAFTDEEVKLAGGLDLGANRQQSDKLPGINLSKLPDRDQQKELQEAMSLARKTIESDPQQTIKDCTLLHNKLGVQAPIYEVAAEAYIRLQLFSDAETCLLTAHSLGSLDASVLLNLANLAAMRGDQRLSLHWLELLAQRQPDHPQLDPVRRNLFPNSAPKTSTNPFQLNLDQRTPGHFN
jgi:tetratricopeptide (TPR) repeat protein